MVIRLKTLRRQEQKINKIKEMMDMYSIKVPSIPSYGYQPVGASSSSAIIDPKIEKTKDLFQMFHLAR